MQATTGSNSYLYYKEENKFGGADVNANYNLFINEANEVDFFLKRNSFIVNNPNAAKLKFFLIEGVSEDKGTLSKRKIFYYMQQWHINQNSPKRCILTNTNFTYGLYSMNNQLSSWYLNLKRTNYSS